MLALMRRFNSGVSSFAKRKVNAPTNKAVANKKCACASKTRLKISMHIKEMTNLLLNKGSAFSSAITLLFKPLMIMTRPSKIMKHEMAPGTKPG